MGKLESQLTKEMTYFRGLALANYYAAYGLSLFAILASIIAGLAVALGSFPKSTLAILSSLPGALLVISQKLRFEERSDWHWKKTHGLKSLIAQLQFEGKSDAEISAQWRKLNEGLVVEWPGLQNMQKEDATSGPPPRSQ